MATSKKKAKKKTAKKGSKIEAALTEAQTVEARAKARPPLMRALFALVELVCMPGLEGDRHVWGKERDELEERRRLTLVEAFVKRDRFQYNADRVSIDDVRTEIENVLVGPSGAGEHSPARIEARALAQRLVDRVFALREQPLRTFMPAAVKRMHEDAQREETERRAAEQRRWKAEAEKRNQAARDREKKRRPAKKKPAAKKAAKASPATKPAAKPAAAKKAGKKSARKPAADPVTKPAAASSPASTSKPTPPPKPATKASPAKPDTTTRARCMELHPNSKERCMHTQGHDVDEQPHETIGGDQW